MLDDTPRLIYLLLLLLAVGGYAMAALRTRPGQALQQMMVWALIFLGVVAVAGLWPDIRMSLLPQQTVHEDGRIEVPMSAGGHYHLTAEVNGVAVRFVVDTGATSIVLSQTDAERVGLNPDRLAFIGQARTANGSVATAPVRLDTLSLGPFTDRNVRAVVNRGALETSLMGMSYLTRFAKVEFDGNRMNLHR